MKKAPTVLEHGGAAELKAHAMNIGKNTPGTSPGDQEWCVRISASVPELVPAALLRAWLIVETFARDKPSCWPGNKALAARLGVGTIRAAQMTLEALEDHGIAERRSLPGNRRVVQLIRRTCEPLTATEWEAMAARARRRVEGRNAAAELRKVRRAHAKPKLKVVG